MLSYLLTRVSEEKLKAILRSSGLEILADGDMEDVARFFVNERGWAQSGPVALICVMASGRESDELLDREVVKVEGLPSKIVADPRLLETLTQLVAAGVRREGFFVLDLHELGLSLGTVRALALAAGVEVVAGMKAVFGPATGGTTEN